jgi:hypothetical protein
MGKPKPWLPVVFGDVAFVPLSQGKTAVIDTVDLGLVYPGPSWHAINPSGSKWYASCIIPGPRSSARRTLHREVLGLRRGDPRQADHIDGNGLNNRRSNLRVASPNQNQHNRRAVGGRSKYKGVDRPRSGRWRASIRNNTTVHPLGFYDTEEEAARAYDLAARVMHGEFGRLNFPEPGERQA